MSSAKFVSDYIQKCLSEGINSFPKIRNKAQEEIKTLDAQISKIEELKTHQLNLRAVIKNLGGSKIKEREDPVMDFTIPEEKLDNKFKDLCIKICHEIENSHPRGVAPSKIIHEIASLEEHKNGYSAIKWLGSRKIIDRDPEDRSVIIGPNWEDRPMNENNQS